MAFGSVLIGRHRLRPLRYSRGTYAHSASDTVSFNFVLEGQLTWHTPSPQRRCQPSDLLILNNVQDWSFTAHTELDHLALVVPRAFLVPALPGCPPSGPLEGTAAWHAVRDFLQAVSALGPHCFARDNAEMIAFALRDMIIAAFAPTAAPVVVIRNKREATLLERLTRVIDAQLDADLTALGLCATLGCSRSTLYRAATPAGGIAELIVRRRLAAIHLILRDPLETRSIAVLAERYGFADVGQFNRRFKLAFGMTAGQVRTQALLSVNGDGIGQNRRLSVGANAHRA